MSHGPSLLPAEAGQGAGALDGPGSGSDKSGAVTTRLRLAEISAWRTLILFGTSDHVLYPDFDRMAAMTFPNHVGPYLLRDCGHFVPWEAPHALVSGIRTFCRDLR